MQFIKVNRERFETVHRDISEGSEPAMRFYILVAVSTLIASFGLISNDTAVIIGAMLVAPLMTPIFGIALALVRGEHDLFARAARAEIVGVTAAVTMACALGAMLGDFDPSAEMLSRTRPNLFDLFVAVLAGFAGAYALVDEKISPALPGVAIATAIVPPLANAGLCISLGEFKGGLGSFLLFFANFLSILIVASITFVASGMAKRYGAELKGRDFARRFSLPIVAFCLISVFLGHSLVNIVQERRLAKIIRATLHDEISQLPGTYMERETHYVQGKRVHVLAGVHSPKYFTPTQVTTMQDRLTQRLERPVELVLHCLLGNNISAVGSVNNVLVPKLDGTFDKFSDSETLNDIGETEQIIREYFSADNSLALRHVENLALDGRRIMMAHASGFRKIGSDEIRLLESRVRQAIGDQSVELVFSNSLKSLKNSQGVLRYGWMLDGQADADVRQAIRRARAILADVFEADNAFDLVNVNATRLDDTIIFLMEILGPEVYPKAKVEALRAQMAAAFHQPIAIYARSGVEVVHAPEGAVSSEELRRRLNTHQKANLPGWAQRALEASSR